MTRMHVAQLTSCPTKNDTFRTFIAEPLDGLQRWQSARPPVALAMLRS